jgi:purine-binding chemotaxis protein CheW
VTNKTVTRNGEPVAVISAEPTISEKNTDQFVVFTLDKEEYGVEILDVREIVKAGKITPIPSAPDFLKGIINLRSNVVCVIDLQRRFTLERDEKEHPSKHILIAEIGTGTFGLLVDEVTDVLRVRRENIKPAPALLTTMIGIEYLKGIGTVAEKLIVFLDLSKVLSEKELVELAKASLKEREHRRTKPKKTETGPEEKAAV